MAHRGREGARRRLTFTEYFVLAGVYPHWQSKQIAEAMGLTLMQVNRAAKRLKLKKSAEYLASPAACRLRRGDSVGHAHRYPKGHVPANKGLRRPGYKAGRMAETQFKKGDKPIGWMPIGSDRINADGYRDRKVADTGYPPDDWKALHRLIWIEAFGPIPKGNRIVFVDGDKTNIALKNLEMLTPAEAMKRNTIHRYPTALKQVIRLSKKLRSTIEKANEKQD